MEFEKLVSPSLKDLFINHIEAMILSGELQVGQQLPPERQLAQSMGVSRAVVNSGVAELERRGFLEVRPRVGTFVTDYRRAGTLDTLKSIMTYNRGRLRNEEIRSILEIRDALGKLAGVAASTVSMAARGERVSQKTAAKIAGALEIPMGELFALHDSEKPLSDKTIQHHHRLLSAILEKAKRERLVPFNVAREHATAPKVQRKEAVYLDDEEARRFLSAVLEERDIRKKAAFVVLLFTGLRRGELCGLSWQDIDEERQVINVVRASQYQQGKGVVEVPTKNVSSVRAVKVPAFVMEVLQEYRAFWNRQRLAWGDAWQGEAGRLFVQHDGKPINPDTINYWLNDFLKRHDLEHITPHSLRHTFATLQIAAGVDIRTLQARTGHAQASTLVNIYSHALKSAQEAASDALESVLLPAKEG